MRRLGFVEFDMRVVKAVRDVPRSVSYLIRVLGSLSSNSYGYEQLKERLGFLVSVGFVVKLSVGKVRLNGETKSSRCVYVATDRGCEALFYYRQFRAVYTSVKQMEVKM